MSFYSGLKQLAAAFPFTGTCGGDTTINVDWRGNLFARARGLGLSRVVSGGFFVLAVREGASRALLAAAALHLLERTLLHLPLGILGQFNVVVVVLGGERGVALHVVHAGLATGVCGLGAIVVSIAAASTVAAAAILRVGAGAVVVVLVLKVGLLVAAISTTITAVVETAATITILAAAISIASAAPAVLVAAVKVAALAALAVFVASSAAMATAASASAVETTALEVAATMMAAAPDSFAIVMALVAPLGA